MSDLFFNICIVAFSSYNIQHTCIYHFNANIINLCFLLFETLNYFFLNIEYEVFLEETTLLRLPL